jgi:hypothetical protein
MRKYLTFVPAVAVAAGLIAATFGWNEHDDIRFSAAF